MNLDVLVVGGHVCPIGKVLYAGRIARSIGERRIFEG